MGNGGPERLEEWGKRIACAAFPEMPAPAAWQAFQSLPGGPELLEALGKAFRFARATPAREALVRAVLAALGRGTLPPSQTPLEAAFREAHRPVWAPLLELAARLPLEPRRIQAAGAAALEILEEILEQPFDDPIHPEEELP